MGHYIIHVVTVEHFTLAVVNIYGYNSHNEDDLLLETLEKHIQTTSNTFPISGIVMGGV